MMLFNTELSIEHFIFPISKEYFDYLQERKIDSPMYYEDLRNGRYGFLKENMIEIQGQSYFIDCILGCSQEPIFDLIGTNELYGMSAFEGTIFAVFLGDDYMYFKPMDSRVYLKKYHEDIEIVLTESYEELIEKITYKEK